MKEIPLKQFVAEEAQRLGVCKRSVRRMMKAGRGCKKVWFDYKPELKRVNKRVIFVTL